MTIPSLYDDSLTPNGSKNFVSTLFVQYTPRYLGENKREWLPED